LIFWKRDNCPSSSGYRTRFLGHLATGLVRIRTELFRLQGMQHYFVLSFGRTITKPLDAPCLFLCVILLFFNASGPALINMVLSYDVLCTTVVQLQHRQFSSFPVCAYNLNLKTGSIMSPRSRLKSGRIYLRFVVDRAVLGQDFLRVVWFSPSVLQKRLFTHGRRHMFLRIKSVVK
jgi:hypothetical protein